MKLSAFPYFAKDTINLTTEENPFALQIDLPIQLIAHNEGWLVQQFDQRILTACNKQDTPLLTSLASREQTQWMLSKLQNTTLVLQYIAPVEVNALNLSLGIDGLISDDLFNKNEIHKNDIDLACQWIEKHFFVNTTNTSTAKKENEIAWLTIKRYSNTAKNKGFQLLGEGWRADVEALFDGKYIIKRITRNSHHDSAFSLLLGNFSCKDISVATALDSPSHKAMLDTALRDNGSYLALWNLYNDKEWENALKKAQASGVLRFTHTEIFEDGRVNRWRIWPKSKEVYDTFKTNWKSLDLNTNTQVDLSTLPPDWAEELSCDEEENQNARGKIKFKLDHLVFTPASNRLDQMPHFPKDKNGGWLYLSLAGQRTIAKRRLHARNTIDSGKRMPQLKWLLEGISVPTERRRQLKDLTPYAKESFKGGTPTEKQRIALDKALNTPDIALIIGPPGTGKTQVIAALQRRLAEIFTGQNPGGEVLISSFQHDAVDNALDRSQVFNLPAIRVGGKKANSDQESGFNLWIDVQSTYLKNQIDKQFKAEPLLKKLDNLFIGLAHLRASQFSPSAQLAQFKDIYAQLIEIEKLRVRVPERLLSDLQDYIDELQKRTPAMNDPSKNAEIMRGIRGLRVTPISFADDGQLKANALYCALKSQLHSLSKEDQALLKLAATTVNPESAFLQQLNKLKNQLIDRYLPDYRPSETKQSVNIKGITLLSRVDSMLDTHARQHKQGIAWALQELVDNLEMDRRSALETIENYAMVIGATCQQSAGKKMESVKSIAASGISDIEFDTVIIDEAARANPLDLFIPMSMAKRRVILVGDDRQLPHMLEPDIEGQLQEEHSLTELELTAFKTSLFERLRLQLEKLKPQRVVMLDTQFRMHRLLGDFVSQQFYEAFGLEEVKTTRPDSDFAFSSEFINALDKKQRSHYENKVCRWMDVPLSEGKDKKSGTSRMREAEADTIAQEVTLLLKAARGSLSIGVITFYSAQRDLILEKLAQQSIDSIPLMIKKEDGYEPHEAFKWATKVKKDGSVEKEEGLRVGTVDAFQGMEFDVVFLSCVRTLPATKLNQNSDTSPIDSELTDEIKLNRMFGFLRLPNRMNVAMSRQRQMLICVGDNELATHDLSKIGVPALTAFYDLCRSNHD